MASYPTFSSITPSEFKDRFCFLIKLYIGYGNKELNEVRHKEPYK